MSLLSLSIPAGILDKITKVRKRRQVIESTVIVLLAVALELVLIAGAIALDWQFGWTQPALRWIPFLIAVGIAVVALVLVSRHVNANRALRFEAREIDRRVPALEERWSTVAELSAAQRDIALTGSPELIAAVVAEAAELEKRIAPENIIPSRTLRPMVVACGAAMVLFGVSAFCLSRHFGTLLQRFVVPWKEITLTRVEVPSNPQRVIRQGSFDIRATMSGRVPASATLLLKDHHGATRSMALKIQSHEGGRFVGHRVAQVDEPFSYQIRAGDVETAWVQVQPVDLPKLTNIEARVVWPDYTEKQPTTWNRLPSGVRVLRGSRLELEFSVDQQVELTALEIARQPSPKRVSAKEVGPRRYRYETDLQRSLHLQVIAENNLGMRNIPAECRIDVDEDQPPVVRILETSQQVALEPDEMLRIEFEAKDDFGLKSAELVATTQKEGEPPRETVIPIELPQQDGTTAIKKSVELDLSKLALDPKTEISYAVRVRDNRTQATSETMAGMPKAGKTETVAENKPNPSEPENDMSKRAFDIPGQTCSAPKDVRIEKYSGKFDGVSREKKTIALDAVLQSLRNSTKEALSCTDSAAEGLPETGVLDPARATKVRDGAAHVDVAKRLTSKLKVESESTPYAFFALQMDGIVKGGLDPAAAGLTAALAGEATRLKLEEASASLRWVLSTLDELTKQYVSLKEVQKAEELFQQIKEMHLVFLEDMPQWLKAGAASPYSRSMVEVDAAFAKAYEEFLKKRRDVYMQLAELLAKHPELQAKFLEASKTATTFFRDELMRLKGEQQNIQRLTAATENSAHNEQAIAALWQTRSQERRSNVATQAAEVAKSATTWMPKEVSREMQASVSAVSNQLGMAAWRATTPNAPGDATAQALTILTGFEDTISRMAETIGRNSPYVRNRFEDIDKLRSALEQNQRLFEMIEQKKFSDAVHNAQGLLNADTGAVAVKIQQESISLVGLGTEVHEAVKKFDDVFARGVTAPQKKASDSLQAKVYRTALASQTAAAAGLESSVEALDDFVQKAIRRMDEANAKGGAPSGAPAPPTLEALLQSLENEKRAAMCLGICCQPMNIQVQSDWLRPTGGPPGSSAMQMQQKRMEEAKESAAAAAREAARAQQEANNRAREMSRRLETALVSKTAAGVANVPSKDGDWNTVPSELRAGLLQERGQASPKRYETAIRQYFRSIAETPSESSAPAPPAPPARPPVK